MTARGKPDHEQHRVGRGPQRGQCQKRHDNGGQRQERIDQPAEHLIEPAAEIAHGQAQRRAEDGAENGGQRSHGQDVARAHDDAGKDVAAQWSVPNQCASEGGVSDCMTSVAKGSQGTTSARTARRGSRRSRSAPRSERTASPSAAAAGRTPPWAGPCRTARSFLPLKADAGVQHGIKQIGKQRGDGEQDADRHDAVLQHRKVLLGGGNVDQAADARQ